jgi:hypothetical protein
MVCRAEEQPGQPLFLSCFPLLRGKNAREMLALRPIRAAVGAFSRFPFKAKYHQKLGVVNLANIPPQPGDSTSHPEQASGDEQR